MDAATAQLNLRTARRVIRERLGLPEANQDWTYEQRALYNNDLAAYILQYPDSFTPAMRDIAGNIVGKNYGTLEDTRFAWGEFADEVTDNAFSLTKLAAVAGIASAVVVLGKELFR